MGIQLLNTDLFGPLPSEMWALLLGRSSSTIKGLTIHPGVIDQDYQGKIKITAPTREKIIDLPVGTRVAQLLLLPLPKLPNAIQHTNRGNNGFGSSDAYWIQQIKTQRPQMTIYINGKKFQGILDTGADVSVISSYHWPKSWPTKTSYSYLQGIGQSQSPLQSVSYLTWTSETGQKGVFQPYIVKKLPVNLWGRDVMSNMHMYIGGPDVHQAFS